MLDAGDPLENEERARSGCAAHSVSLRLSLTMSRSQSRGPIAKSTSDWLRKGTRCGIVGLVLLGWVAVGDARADSTGFDVAAIEKRFVELRDGRGLGCLLDQAIKGGTPKYFFELVTERAPPLLVRIAAAAAVERVRRNGESATLQVLGVAVGALALVNDVEGLRSAFAQADRIKAQYPQLALPDSSIAYRARIGLPIETRERDSHLLEVIQETALGGDLKAAGALHDSAVKRRPFNTAHEGESHVGALAALERIETLRAVIAKAKPADRYGLTLRWLNVALQKRDTLRPAVDALIAVSTKQAIGSGLVATLLKAQRLGRAAELAPLRKHLIALLQPDDWKHIPGVIGPLYDAILNSGDAADRAKLEAIIPAEEARSIRVVREAPLGEVLVHAKLQKDPLRELTTAWARYIEQGASDAAFATQLEAAACPPARPIAGPPTSPAKAKLTVIEKPRKPQAECQPVDTRVRLTSGHSVLDELTLRGECKGLCTAAEKRRGAAELRRIQSAIARGEASDSETDSSFTDCMFSGTLSGRIDQVGEREVAILINRYIGPHAVEKIRYQLTTEVCNRIFLSKSFAGEYSVDWKLDELSLRESADHAQLEVFAAKDSWRGVVYRLSLPRCPGPPTEEVIETQQ